MSTSEDETFAVIKWAKKESKDNEIIALFWKELCKAVREDKDTSPEKVYHELRLYGGNTIMNIFRDNQGVLYDEVAYDVANALRSWNEKFNYKEGEIVSCENFVLEKMEVKIDDINKMANAFSGKGENNGFEKGVSQTVGVAVTRGVAHIVAEQAAKKAGEQAAKKVAEQAAKKAAQQAAEEVAKQVTSRIIAAVNIILIGYTIISIAGPARRVTIPGVTYVALLRKIYHAKQAGF